MSDNKMYSSGKGQQHDEGEACGEAVRASMQAIAEYCGGEGVPLQTSSGVVVMAPKDEMDRVKNAAPGDMSDGEVMAFIEDSPWLRNWTEALCSRAGLSEGTDGYDNCLLNYARDVLS